MTNPIGQTQHLSTVLTGIKPTGVPHIGNYLGAIAPALRRSGEFDQSFFFIADYHALNSIQSSEQMSELPRVVAATWLASGLDPKKVHFYRQSAIPEIFELETILNAFIPKGWMNKMHAYKASVDINRQTGKTDDDGVNMGLYTYPILMACDILMFNTTAVPVGKDQVQHVEIARDIAQRFNKNYATDAITLPNYILEEGIEEVPGLDGRKMSKSYNNTIPLFASREQWTNAVRQVVTDNITHTPESFRETVLYKLFSAIADRPATDALMHDFVSGSIGWKLAKDRLVDALEDRFKEPSKKYFELMENPSKIDTLLREGGEAIRPIAQHNLAAIKSIIGIR